VFLLTHSTATLPQDPKKLTDEELKKFGIHVASRLNPDDHKGQSSWADIEDDDADWTPDAITWKDGTKISIAHHEDNSNQELEKKENGASADKPKSPTPGTASPSMKPGLALKGSSEKPTLVAKPPAPPPPTKSPWAPLPKIEKVSPVVVEPTPSEANAPSRDAHPTAPPLREMSADDFSRGPWRDGAPPGNRELFNSRSGRYEPVFDRRGPPPPSLLQRSHPDQPGPHDPPGAGSWRNDPYDRRRGSSTVSGGSGSWRYRGPEHPLPPPELIQARRGSMTAGSEGPGFSPMSPRGFSPHGGPRQGSWGPRASPSVTHATPYQPAPPQQSPLQPSAVVVTEEDFELQKKLMIQKREEARRRRLEEEAREEAARRERLRAKLEALGPAPESRSQRKAAEEAAKKAAAEKAAAEKAAAEKKAVEERQAAEGAAKEAEKVTPEKEKPLTQHDSPKEQAQAPPAPTPAPAPAPAPTQIQPHEQSAPPQPEQPPAPQPTAMPPTVALEPAKQPTLSANGMQPQPLSSHTNLEPHPHPHGVPGQPHSHHPWGPPPPRPGDRLPPVSWGPQPQTKNVWAAPNNRSLGNGTFASDLGPHLPPVGPGPIAPPNGARNLTSQAPGMPAQPARQPPIGPPSHQLPQAERERDVNRNAWAAAARLNDEKFTAMLKPQFEEPERRPQADGRSLNQPIVRDTWRPVKTDENGRRIEADTTHSRQIGQDKSWASTAQSQPAVAQQAPAGPSVTEYSTSFLGTTAAPSSARGSRFFPVRQEPVEPIAPEVQVRPKSPSPPPPDMPGHPAFDGDASHPHVSLPGPRPVVRLPPTGPAREPLRLTPASEKPKPQAWTSQQVTQESEPAPTTTRKPDNVWQARIDSLLGDRKVPHPVKAPVPVPHVEPLSRASQQQREAPAKAVVAEEEPRITKPMAEECFEEQEMGSLPVVRVPTVVPEMAWQPSPPPEPLPKKLLPHATSADPISFPPDVSGAGTVWHIRIPGAEPKTVIVPFGRTRSNPRRGGGPRGGRHSGAGPRQSRGPRDGSNTYGGQQNTGSGPHSRGHGRGGYRGRENWNRGAAPVQS